MKFVVGCWLALAGVLSAANLSFTEVKKEIKMGLEDTKGTVDYPFKNESGKPITIKEAKGFCSCTSVQISGGKTFYKPGESGVIRVNLDMGNETGTVEKAVGIFLEGDAEANPSQQLTVVIHIPVLVEIEPKSVKWAIGDAKEPKTIRLKMKAEQPIHIKSVSTSTENFTQELKVLEDGRDYELVVTPKSTEANALTIFRLETDCTIKNHGTLQVFGVVSKGPKR
ncbi:MAG TPA: DUF1573 domain-containing protein [Luteolibacter sp.]|nr:DUF1573 domain-containing protein [Luteolibacter sp.]